METQRNMIDLNFSCRLMWYTIRWQLVRVDHRRKHEICIETFVSMYYTTREIFRLVWLPPS